VEGRQGNESLSLPINRSLRKRAYTMAQRITNKGKSAQKLSAVKNAKKGAKPGQVVLSTFAEIKIPAELRMQHTTGIPEVDALFAGKGIRPSTVCLFTGIPGGGKTTLSLEMASSLALQGHVVLYNGCEESAAQLKMNTERMKLPGIEKVYISDFSEVGEIIAACKQLQEKNKGKQVFLFVDSLQTIEKAKEEGTRGRDLSQQNQAVVATWDIASWCKETMGIAVVIGMVGKDGNFLGKNDIKHAIDCHLHLAVDKDKDSDMKGERFAEMQKNRFGQTGIPFYYQTTSKGVEFNNCATGK